MPRSSKNQYKKPIVEDGLVTTVKSWLWKAKCPFDGEIINTPSHGSEVRCEKCMRFFRVYTRRDALNGSVAYWGLITVRTDECCMCKMGTVYWEGEVGKCIMCKQEWKLIGPQKQMVPINIKPAPDIAEMIRRRRE